MGLTAEDRVISHLEDKYMTERKSNIYTACEDLNFQWDEREVVKIDRLWNHGYSLGYIVEKANRDGDEVFILLLDRIRNGFIQPRKGGIFGRTDGSYRIVWSPNPLSVVKDPGSSLEEVTHIWQQAREVAE